MADSKILEDQDKLKRNMIKVLDCIAAVSSAAAVVNPIFGVAGSLIRLVLHRVDDKEIKNLQCEFGSMNQALDELSKKNSATVHQIQKETVDGQYNSIEENLRNQFKMYMKVLEAKPENKERMRDDFKESYGKDMGDQNLHTLYDSVMGKPKLFSRPILEVYMNHSQGDTTVMDHLCTRLTYLFCIGLIALMGYAAIIGDDEEGLSKEWAEKMEKVEGKMQEVLSKCK